MTDHEAYIAFNMVPNIGAVKVAALAEKHGSVAAAWEAFGRKTNWEGKPVDVRAEMARARKMHVTLVTCDDPRYPASLNDLPSKPLVLYVPDYESYCADRGFFMPHEEIPGVRVFAEKELADAVRQAGSRSPEEKAADDAARRAFLEKWMSACDGHSTQRIAGYLEGI